MMPVPVLGVPVINRPDLLSALLRSIDVPVERLVIVDNGDCTDDLGLPAGAVVRPPANLGVAASWNFIIRTTPAAPWWCIANADAELTGGDLARLAGEMERPGPRWVGMNGDWRVFGINADAIECVGFFDEGFHPCYVEDADMEYRCTLAGVPWYTISAGATHLGSAAIRSDPALAERNATTYRQNVARYEEKWGGPLRGGEVYTTPWNRGGHVGDWRLPLSVVRDQAWT